MNSEIKMNISSLIRGNDSKSAYVLFTDGDKEAEFVVPERRLLSNKGFSDKEIEELKEYLLNEKEYIFSVAGKVNPMKGFMGKPQGV